LDNQSCCANIAKSFLLATFDFEILFLIEVNVGGSYPCTSWAWAFKYLHPNSRVFLPEVGVAPRVIYDDDATLFNLSFGERKANRAPVIL
jgi:hypothetical protein